MIDRIAELDKDAFSENVECAALKARLQRERNDLEGAAATYRQALECNPESYYLAAVLGQSLLRLGRIEEARGAYRRAGEIIDQLPEQNVWTHATRVTAALMLGDEPRALRHLGEIAALPPSLDDVARIEAGLERVQKGLDLDGRCPRALARRAERRAVTDAGTLTRAAAVDAQQIVASAWRDQAVWSETANRLKAELTGGAIARRSRA